MFGDSTFDRYIILDCGADKDNVLLEYADTDCFWVEDKAKNADVGLDYGLDSLLMSHPHNRYYDGDATVVRNWKEIYEIITGE
jgi:hypothetical protein